jgi:hypothetical protein
LVTLVPRLDSNERYFNDTWEGLPKNGYTAFFRNLILNDPKITVRLELDYFKVKGQFYVCSVLRIKNDNSWSSSGCILFKTYSLSDEELNLAN